MLDRTSSLWAVVSLCAVLANVVVATDARAQDDEVAGDARGDYAWGSGGGGAMAAEDPMRIMGYAGVGIGLRPVRNVDPAFQQDLLAPAYLDLGAALYLPGGDIRHGPAFFLSTTLSDEFGAAGEPRALTQWSLTPGYQILVPFQRVLGMEYDWLQLQGRIGIPIVLSGQDDTVYVTPGVELAAALHFKFLAGMGVYLEIQGDLYGGAQDTVHPVLAADLGFLIDYELLP